jgi:hypothetical protein
MLNALALSPNKKTNENNSLLAWARANVQKRSILRQTCLLELCTLFQKMSYKVVIRSKQI